MRVPSSDGVELELHDMGGDGPPCLVVHATGFCAGAYRPATATLAQRLHVWGLDVRAHGDATTPSGTDLSWRGMIDDVLAAVDAIDAGPVFGFGHSMGGACLLGAELRRPGTLLRAFVFEPIIVPPTWNDAPGHNPLADAARRRRPSFDSRPEALARYASRPPLGAFRADALAAYVTHGFADQPDGTIRLKCEPEDEARTFEAPAKPTVAEMAHVATPTVVARGCRDGDLGPAGLAGLVADALPQGQLSRYQHLGHFGPLADPDTLADDAVAFFLEN